MKLIHNDRKIIKYNTCSLWIAFYIILLRIWNSVNVLFYPQNIKLFQTCPKRLNYFENRNEELFKNKNILNNNYFTLLMFTNKCVSIQCEKTRYGQMFPMFCKTFFTIGV